jgi:hypothetical protein
MRSTIVVLFVFFLLTLGAKANVGMGYLEAKHFYGNHDFFLKSFTGELSYPTFSLYRYLENDAMLKLTGIFDNCDCYPPSNEEMLNSVVITHIDLKPNGTEICLSRENPYLCGDQYSSSQSNFWNRKSTKAMQILEKIYGKKISKDFSESRMVYNGSLYSSELYNDSFRIRKQGDGITGKTKIFFGKIHSYQIIEESDGENHFKLTNVDTLNRFINMNKSEKLLFERKLKEFQKHTPAVL